MHKDQAPDPEWLTGVNAHDQTLVEFKAQLPKWIVEVLEQISKCIQENSGTAEAHGALAIGFAFSDCLSERRLCTRVAPLGPAAELAEPAQHQQYHILDAVGLVVGSFSNLSANTSHCFCSNNPKLIRAFSEHYQNSVLEAFTNDD